MFSVDFCNVRSIYCRLFFCYDNLENVAGIVPLQAAIQRTFNHSVQNLPVLRSAS